MELLSKLGIDWRLLIGQIVNFLIVLAILYKFVYHPLLNLLKQREDKIAKSVADAKKIEENLKKSEAEKDKIAADARRQAENLLKKTEETADKIKTEINQQAKKEAEKILKDARRMILDEKEKTLKEIKGQTADLVIAVVEKVISKKITEKKDKEIIEELLHL